MALFGNGLLGGQQPGMQQPMLPRVPWQQNPLVTSTALGLLGGRNINEGFANAAAAAPAGMAAKSGMQQFMLAQQERQAQKAEQEQRRAAMNEVIKNWSGLNDQQRALFSAQPELFGQYAMSTMGPQETFRPLTDPNERIQFGIRPDDPTPYQVGPDNKVYAIGGGGTNVNIDNVGTIPQGYELTTDPATGAKRMQPIPGGPADTSQKDAARQEQQGRYGDVVLDDIRRAKKMVKDQSWYAPVTGAGGQVLSGVGGTAAKDLAALISPIEASIGFDRLQAMREASPTGGALGAVSDRELTLLKATLGSLDQAQSKDQLLYNLDRLEEIYTTIMKKASAYPNAADYGFADAGGDDGWTEVEPGIRIREKP